MSYKIYPVKYQDYKYALEYFDPNCGQYDVIYFTTKKDAKQFIKKIKENL